MCVCVCVCAFGQLYGSRGLRGVEEMLAPLCCYLFHPTAVFIHGCFCEGIFKGDLVGHLVSSN